MRSALVFAGWFAMALVACVPANAQASADTTSRARIEFTFERTGLPVPKFSLAVDEDGSGTYKAEEGTDHYERTVALPAGTTAKLFALARSSQLTQEACASKARNIADTGTKTLTYTAAGTTTKCTYNYTERKNVERLTEIFQGLAAMMDEGYTLEHLHRYDRLGLDAEMISLADAVSSGRALDPSTIAPCLRAIADDPEVIHRVRVQAAKLLVLASADAASR